MNFCILSIIPSSIDLIVLFIKSSQFRLDPVCECRSGCQVWCSTIWNMDIDVTQNNGSLSESILICTQFTSRQMVLYKFRVIAVVNPDFSQNVCLICAEWSLSLDAVFLIFVFSWASQCSGFVKTWDCYHNYRYH